MTPTPTTPTTKQQGHLATFYSILGKVLGLAIVGASAYSESQTLGATSLLQPQNLAALIQETENVIMTPATTP